MNKLGMVLGIAAVAVVAGCKDPGYARKPSAQNEAKNAVAEAGTPVDNVSAAEVADAPAPAVTETAPAPAVTPTPIVTDAPAAKTEVKPVAVPAEPEYTMYIVQRGDYLAKISKKYNIKVDAIKKINNMKDDTVRIGQKIKLPGKVEVGAQTVPEGAIAKPVAKASAKAYAPYTGATKEYVVKSGDTLGAIAYGNGINVRQLKELNGLSSDALKIGQKLKIPAEKVVASAKAETKPVVAPKLVVAQKPVVAPKPVEESVSAVGPAGVPAASDDEAVPTVETTPVPAVPDTAATPAPVETQAAATHIVQEGEDLTSVAIRWGVSTAAITELNNLGENTKLVPGQILKLPAEAAAQ